VYVSSKQNFKSDVIFKNYPMVGDIAAGTFEPGFIRFNFTGANWQLVNAGAVVL
jgi:hypothetical protein